MARQVIHSLIDDLDGGPADESIRFGLDGIEFEIDLSKKNASAMRKTLNKYVEAARREPRPGPGRGRRVGAVSRTRVDRDQNAAIRDWAKRSGQPVSDRGRIPQAVVDAYHAAGGIG
jgi:hypothetical protein